MAQENTSPLSVFLLGEHTDIEDEGERRLVWGTLERAIEIYKHRMMRVYPSLRRSYCMTKLVRTGLAIDYRHKEGEIEVLDSRLIINHASLRDGNVYIMCGRSVMFGHVVVDTAIPTDSKVHDLESSFATSFIAITEVSRSIRYACRV